MRSHTRRAPLSPSRSGASLAQWRQVAALAGPLVIVWAGPAGAKEVKVPETKPKVLLDIPDDWTVSSIPAGLLLRSSDKKVLIVAGLVKLGKAELAGWQKQAGQEMTGAGVAFDPNAKAPPRAAKPTPAPTGKDAAEKAPDSVFSGAPTLGTPEQAPKVETATEDKKMEGLSLEQLTGKAPLDRPQLRYKSAVIYGATVDGKAVDVQFLNFAVAKGTAFLMQQESSPTDDRIGGIVNSVRLAP